jgi:Domain of unknown function (DUF4136)
MGSITWMSIGLAAVFCWTACPAWAQRTSYGYGHQDLTGFKTFAFKQEPVTEGTGETTSTYDSPIVDERTRAAVAAQLESRGLTRSDDHPDLWVITRRTFRTQYAISPYPDPWTANGWGWPYGWPIYRYDWAGNGPVQPAATVRGTLIIDIRDASGHLIWRGVGDRRVHQTSKPSHRTRHVDDEVDEIFENLAP